MEITDRDAIGIMRVEKECVKRQDGPLCPKDSNGVKQCAYCDLCQPTEKVLAAYDKAIQALNCVPFIQDMDFTIRRLKAENKALKDRPQGEWINDFDRFSCPFCKMSIDDEVHYLYPKGYGFNYCPNCGKKLNGGTKE